MGAGVFGRVSHVVHHHHSFLTVAEKENKFLVTVQFEPMSLDDLNRVMEIECATYSHPWSKKSMQDELDRNFALCRVARINNQVKGYLIAWLIRGEIHLLNLALDPDVKRLGLGGLFLKYLFDWGRKNGAAQVFLEVRESNLPARRLYEKTGFVMIGRRINYYPEEKEDAITMARCI